MARRYALIIIDMLNDFVNGKLKCERALPMIPRMQKLIKSARAAGIPVIYCNDAHLPVDNELKIWGPHAMAGTHEAEVISELKPEKGDYQIPKRTYSSFHETGLDILLRDLYDGQGANTIIVAGLHTHICARHTSADAHFRGYDVVLAEDCCESFTEADHKAGLEYIKTMYKAELKKADELIAEFENMTASAKPRPSSA